MFTQGEDRGVEDSFFPAFSGVVRIAWKVCIAREKNVLGIERVIREVRVAWKEYLFFSDLDFPGYEKFGGVTRVQPDSV